LIEFIGKNLDKIVAVALIVVVAYLILNAIGTRRFFRRQFKKSIESLSLPALMDEMTNNREKYRRLTDQMMEELSDKQLLEALYYHLLAQARQENQQIETLIFLSDGPKRIASILVVAQEAFRMSGFLEAFRYTPRFLSGEVADAYQTIGAKHCGKVVWKAAEYYSALPETPTQAMRAQLKSYDEALRWYNKTEKVESLIAAYVRGNRTGFVTERQGVRVNTR